MTSIRQSLNQDIIALCSGCHAEPGSMEFIPGLEAVFDRLQYRQGRLVTKTNLKGAF